MFYYPIAPIKRAAMLQDFDRRAPPGHSSASPAGPAPLPPSG
jgi:hypothetical protein